MNTKKQQKKTAYMSMKISASLKKRIEEIAQKEHRSMADQMIYLVEKGLLAFEKGTTNG
jgi:predicted transcriptional regulator